MVLFCVHRPNLGCPCRSICLLFFRPCAWFRRGPAFLFLPHAICHHITLAPFPCSSLHFPSSPQGVDSQPNTYGIDHGAQDAHQKAVTYGNAYQTPSQPSYAVDSASQRPEMSWGPTNSASTPALQKNAPAFPLRSPSNPSVPSYTAHSYTSSATYATMAGQSEYERKLAKSDPNLHQAAATRHMPRSAPFPKVEGFSYYGKTPDSTTHPGHFETQLFSLSAPVDAPDFVDLEMAANTSTAYRDVRMSRPQQTTQMAPQNTFPSTLSHRPANAQAYPVASHQPIAPQQPRVSGMQGSYPAHMAQPQNYPTSAPQQHQTPQYAEPPRYSEDMYRAQYAHMQQYGAGYSQASQSTQYAYGPSEGSYSVGYPPHPREGHYGPQATPQATPRSPHSAGSSSDSRSPRSAFSGMEQPSGYQHAQRGEIDEYEASMLPHKRAKQYETIENAPMPSYAPTTSSEGDDTSSDTAGYWTPQS